MDGVWNQLFDNLKLPEYRSRYRTRRELRGRESEKVLKGLKQWVNKLNKKDARYEDHLLEALWVTWGLGKIDESYLKTLLNSKEAVCVKPMSLIYPTPSLISL